MAPMSVRRCSCSVIALALALVGCGAPPEAPPSPVVAPEPDSSQPEPEEEARVLTDIAADDGEPIVLAEHEANGVKFSLESRQKTWLLGDNVILYYVVENVSAAKVDVAFGGDYRGGPRAERVHLTATGPDGKPLVDPFPEGMNFGGLGATYTLKKGESFVFSIPVHRYRHFEQSGSYVIRVAHDLGWTSEDDSIAADDPRWVEASLQFAEPSAEQARAVVARMQSRSSDPSVSAGERTRPFADFSSLVFPVYLALLEPIAAKEKRAFHGLSRIATLEATRALIRLGSHEDADVAQAALEALEQRVPNPGQKHPMKSAERDRLVAGGWDSRKLGRQLRALALALLGDADDQRVILGARLLAAAVEPKDVSLVVSALSDALEATKDSPIPYPEPRTPVSALIQTTTVLLEGGAVPPAAPKTPGEIVAYLLAHADATSKPADYATRIAGWLEHPIPQVRVLTLRQQTGALDPAAIAKLPKLLADGHLGVKNAACEALAKAGEDATVHSVVKAQMRTATDDWLVRCLNGAAKSVGIPRDEVARIWISRLDEEARTMLIFDQLLAFVDSKQHGMSGTPDAAEAKRLKKVWTAWITKHAVEVRSGKTYEPGGPDFSTELVPKGFNFTSSDGKSWP